MIHTRSIQLPVSLKSPLLMLLWLVLLRRHTHIHRPLQNLHYHRTNTWNGKNAKKDKDASTALPISVWALNNVTALIWSRCRAIIQSQLCMHEMRFLEFRKHYPFHPHHGDALHDFRFALRLTTSHTGSFSSRSPVARYHQSFAWTIIRFVSIGSECATDLPVWLNR